MSAKRLGLVLGPLICLIFCLEPSALVSSDAWRVMGLAAWMIIWWVSEALPIGITSLLPIIFLPLSGVSKLEEASTPYGSPIVFLFLGGFILALALEKWKIHERVALKILSLTGTSANGVVFGFMGATALLSMWMSNTATTLMMLPIALSVLQLLREGGSNEDQRPEYVLGMERFGISLMLAVAYGANIGGTMTLIGTPPNIVLMNFINQGYEATEAPLTFLGWLKIGIPFGIIALILTFLLLVYLLYPSRLGEVKGAGKVISEARQAQGSWTSGQLRVSVVFLLTAVCWIFRKQLCEYLSIKDLSDAAIGLIGASVLFAIPSGESDDNQRGRPLLTWADMNRLPWDIVLLFGGGLSLARALKDVGLIQAIGDQFSNLGSLSVSSLATLILIALFLTEVMSNVALVSVFVPVISAVAVGLGIPPLALCVPVTLAASCAFMLPMSTPPNAIVFASGHVQIKHMVKAGLLLNVISVIWITMLTRWFYF